MDVKNLQFFITIVFIYTSIKELYFIRNQVDKTVIKGLYQISSADISRPRKIAKSYKQKSTGYITSKKDLKGKQAVV